MYPFFQITPVLEPKMYHDLSAIFPQISIKPSEEIGCEPGHFSIVNTHMIKTFSKKQELFEFARSKRIMISKFGTEYKLLSEFEKQLRQEFRFKPELSQKSETTLQKLKLTHLKKINVEEGSYKTLNFVGVHVRRTDYEGKFQMLLV